MYPSTGGESIMYKMYNHFSNEMFELPLKSESPPYGLRTFDEVMLSF